MNSIAMADCSSAGTPVGEPVGKPVGEPVGKPVGMQGALRVDAIRSARRTIARVWHSACPKRAARGT